MPSLPEQQRRRGDAVPASSEQSSDQDAGDVVGSDACDVCDVCAAPATMATVVTDHDPGTALRGWACDQHADKVLSAATVWRQVVQPPRQIMRAAAVWREVLQP